MRAAATILILILGASSLACSREGSEPRTESAGSTTPTAQGEPSPEAEVEPPPPDLADVRGPISVPGTANIFIAGRSFDKVGGGSAPPGWELPPRSRTVIFTSVKGRVAQVDHGSKEGPAGRGLGRTNVESYEGIAGIVHRHNIMFLVGVFLSDSLPSDPPPRRLNVTEQTSVVAPELAQVFLVGDGKGSTYRVPSGATRLFLGFARAANLTPACHPTEFIGPPGCYFSNSGRLGVSIEVD